MPTLNEWGMIVLVVGLAIAGMRYARAATRHRRTRR
ncbi:MAG: IPTL-CTERM sorting domain-containing protein [Vicinamibacteria bacterium]